MTLIECIFFADVEDLLTSAMSCKKINQGRKAIHPINNIKRRICQTIADGTVLYYLEVREVRDRKIKAQTTSLRNRCSPKKLQNLKIEASP